MKEWCSRVNSASHFAAAFIFYLERVSHAEIGLDKIVAASPPICMINEVVTRLGEHSDMGSKAIFESTADVPEWATLDTPGDAVESRIELGKTSIDGLSTAASKDRSEPNETVGRQVNARPELIQR
jgi:hypothetical protein